MPTPSDPPAPPPPAINEDGVDLAQIRAMLALTPEERLRKCEEFAASMQEIWELNDARPIR